MEEELASAAASLSLSGPPPPMGMHMPRLDLPPPAKKKPATPGEIIAYKEGLRSKGEKLIFDPRKDGDVRQWKGFTPSNCTVQDGVRQVRVNKPGLSVLEMAPVNDEMLTELDEEFAEAVKTDKEKITVGFIAELAQKYDFKTGKWLVMEKWRYVDKLFQGLVEALVEGKLPPSVLFVKITGRDDSEENPHGDTCKLSIVTSDFADENAVMAVRDSIRSLDFRRNMKYKADIYTRLKIFAGNEFGIIPSMYSSMGDMMPSQRGRGGRGRGGGGEHRGGGFGRGRGAPYRGNRDHDGDGGDRGQQRQQRGWFGNERKEGRATEDTNWRRKTDDAGDK